MKKVSMGQTVQQRKYKKMRNMKIRPIIFKQKQENGIWIPFRKLSNSISFGIDIICIIWNNGLYSIAIRIEFTLTQYCVCGLSLFDFYTTKNNTKKKPKRESKISEIMCRPKILFHSLAKRIQR